MSTASAHAPAASVAPPPPGPRTEPLLGNMRALRRAPLDYFLAQVREHGDVVRFWLGPKPVTLVAHPDGVRHVLQDNVRNYNKQTRGFAVVRELLGQGLLTSEGDFWLRQRRLAQPAFHRQRLASFASTMVEAAEELATRLDARCAPGAAFDVAEEFNHLTLSVTSRTLFGSDIGASVSRDIGEALARVQAFANARLTQLLPLPRALPLPSHLRMRRDLDMLDRVVRELIERRRADTGTHHDLLAMLMEARDEDTQERMSDTQLRDEVMTLMVAGHETTASALSWTMVLLSRHPDVRRRLETELAQVLQGRSPTVEDLPKLALTRRIIDESMRLFPPAWISSRAALQDDVIGGYHIPAGSFVLVSPWVTHRHPRLWENPEGFDPDRFLPELERERSRFTYFPFGGGPRQCIGNQFSLMEMVLVLATLVSRLRLDLAPGHPFVPAPAITLRPRPGVWMTASRPRAATPASGTGQ
ncbi:cytochrome P450 [Corallococcus sp. M34]|uniref:cytochrome P450 n=1 Tax=Citreicoccus inhibens TaxID=2849499 RepID=UPI001C233652|nr:cytochrome P450 [Citreicoccus inhibens]MBU8894264.1 cytochrome P450 [Citreicoccus inhibens]